MSRARSWVALALAAAMVFAACGSDNNTGGTTTAGGGGATTSTVGELTDSFRGVTATEIKLGLAYVDSSASPISSIKPGDTKDQTRWWRTQRQRGWAVALPSCTRLCPSPRGVVAGTALNDDDQVFASRRVRHAASRQKCSACRGTHDLINGMVTKVTMDQPTGPALNRHPPRTRLRR